jgi:hypothetical protein
MNSILRSIHPAVVALAASMILPASALAEEAPASPLSVAVLNFADGSN